MHLGFLAQKLYLGIWDFLKSADFYPGDREFLKISGFVFPGIGDFPKFIGDFENLGIFIPGDRGFFGNLGCMVICSDPVSADSLNFWGFLSPDPEDCRTLRIGDFLFPGLFLGCEFFVGWCIPPKSNLCLN